MFSRFEIPRYRYFPTDLMETEGPKNWAQLRILQACERLKIPKDLWPKLPKLKMPHGYEYSYQFENHTAPPFEALHESVAEWRQRARDNFEEFLDKQVATASQWLDEAVGKGELTPVQQARDITPCASAMNGRPAGIACASPIRP